MSRSGERSQWPLVALSVLAGVATAALVLFLFLQAIRGSAGTTVLVEPDTAVATVDTPRRERNPVIGAREAAVMRRLAAVPVNEQPLRGRLTVRAADIVWLDPGGDRFLTAAHATGLLRADGVNRADIVLDDFVVTDPVVMLEERSGTWNFESVFAELLRPSNNSGPKKTIRLHSARIEDGTVRVRRPDHAFDFRDVNAALPLIVLSEPGVADPFLEVASADANMVRLEPAEPPVDVALAIANGDFVFPDGTVRFAVEAASIERSRLTELVGSWDPAQPGYGVTMTGRGVEVFLADLAEFAPDRLPADGAASFTFGMRPATGDRTEITLRNIDATSGDTRARGSVGFVFGEEHFRVVDADLGLDPLNLALVERFLGRSLPWQGVVAGSVTGTRGDIAFDVTGTLTTPDVTTPFDADLTGRIVLGEGGASIRRLTVDAEDLPLLALRAIAPGLPVTGLATGSLAVTGVDGSGPLGIETRLELGGGVVIVSGTVDLTGSAPAYNLTGSLIGIRLADVLTPRVPPALLSGRFEAEGRGTSPDSMQARFALDGRFGGWRTDSNDTIRLAARVDRGFLTVDTLYTSLATAELGGSGTWMFSEHQGTPSGAVRYALSVSSLEPFGPYLPATPDSIAAGSINASGAVSGLLSSLALEGRLEGTGVTASGWSAATLAGTYAVRLGSPIPATSVNMAATGISTATAGAYTQAELVLELAPPDLTFRLNADRRNGGQLAVVATGVVPETGAREVTLSELVLDLAEESWNLERPALVRWTPKGPIEVVGFAVRSDRGAGRIAVDGRLVPLSELDARLDVAALPVAGLQRLAGRDPVVEGLVWTAGTIRGGVSSEVELEFRLEEGLVRGVAVERLGGRLTHTDGLTGLTAELQSESGGSLDVAVSLPSRLRIGLDTIFDLTDGMPVSGSVTAERLELSPLGALTPRVRELAGVVNGQFSLSGTAEQPVVAGTMSLDSGSVFLPDVNQRYGSIAGGIDFDGRELRFRNLRARSDGWLEVEGGIVLERLDDPVFDVAVQLDGFRPLGVDDHEDAAVTGTVTVDGSIGALVVSGNVEVHDGHVVIPEMGGGFSSELVDLTRPGPTASTQTEPAPDPFRNLRIRDLRVRVGTDAWFHAADAEVQLTGDLVVNRDGEDFPITGTLTGTRGQYTLIAGPIVRRFDIVAAQIRFLGTPEPAPLVDITARRIVIDQEGRELDVDVRITGSLDAPRLSVAGGEGAAIAESELLSLLIFGQSNADLLGAQGGGLPGQLVLQEALYGGFAELLTLEFERSLSGIGLDVFQVRLGAGKYGGLTTPTLVVGRRVARDVMLTAETALALLDEQQAPINTWALRLDWTFDRRSRLRLSWEPVFQGRTLRSFSGLALPSLGESERQFLLELRRRWTW